MFGIGTGITTLGMSGGIADAADNSFLADLALGTETNGFAADFRDMSLAIRDTTTPANAYSGDPNGKLTYAAPSTKWILGSNGLFQSGTTLRTEYDAAGNALGLRIEPAATNLALRSQEFDSATWTKSALTVSANAATAPDGSLTADMLVASAVTSTHDVTQVIAIASGSTYTYSVFLKAAGLTWACLEGGGGAGGFTVWFDLAAGAVGTVTGATSASITALPNGWFRCSVTDATTSTSGNYRIYATNADNVQSFTGDGVSGVYVWQAQLELGSVATAPVATAGSAVTRAADNISVLGTLFPLSSTEGTLIIESSTFSPVATARFSATISDGTTNERYSHFFGGANQAPSMQVTDGGVDQASMSTAVIPVGTFARTAIAYALNDFAVCTNGGTVVTDGAGSLPTVDRMHLGSRLNAAHLAGHIRSVLYLPRRMINAEMQGVTA